MDIQTDQFPNSRVLVTGGAGFIGSNLARRLADLGADVTVIDSLIPDYGGNLFNLEGYEDRIHLNIADVRDPYSMNYLVRGRDYIFNLAGQVSHTDSMQNPFPDLEINVHAQLSILEACRHYNPGARLVFTSTRQVYGRPKYLPVDEGHPLCPVDVNGINKIAAEKYHLLYGEIYGLPVTVLRLTNCFGPRMRIRDARQTFTGWWIRQLLEGSPIKVYGDGSQMRDINYVDDVVQALLTAALSPAAVGKVYNLGGECISLLDLARRMLEVNGAGQLTLVDFPEKNKAIDIGSYYGDFSLIRDEVGWSPAISLDEGIRRSLEYYRQFMGKYI